MELKNAVHALKACETFVENTKTNVSTVDDLMVLSEINGNISDNINFVRRWLNNDITFGDITTMPTEETTEPWLAIAPDAEWRRIFDMNLMVSNYGNIWDMSTRQELKKYFIDGDLRVILGHDSSRDSRRAAPIITKAFQIRSPDRGAEYIIGFKDSDRRNLRTDNLYWKKPSTDVTDISRQYLIEDICRRIIEHDGDIDAIFERYVGSRPSVSKAAIQQIMEKKLYTEVSDLFFVYDNGNIYPRTDAMATDTSANKSVDIAGFFMMSNDRKVSGDLLRDKIKRNESLSIDEKVIIVFMAMDIIGISKANDVKKIANVIKNTFGCDLGYDFINQVRNDYTSEISIMFRGEAK